MTYFRVFLILSCLLAEPSAGLGRTWHILNDGSGDSPTIQAGIDSSALGDTVLVGPGSYLENIDFVGKDILVRSELGAEITTIDGSGRPETVVLFRNRESRRATLEGFTLTGGSG